MSPVYSRTKPFLASVKERYTLSKEGSEKFTHHVVLDIKGSGIDYVVGDSVGIYPAHDATLVQATLDALQAQGSEEVLDKNTGNKVSLREFLSKKANLTEINRKIVMEIAERQPQLDKKAQLNLLLQETHKVELKAHLKERELWDFLLEHAEVRFTPEEIINFIQPMLPRFYSIASSKQASGEEIHLTVSYVKYISNQHQRFGVCSHYLCDLIPLYQPLVPLYIQPHHGFTLPPQSDAAMIMVGAGTGIAPYRAFMQERLFKGDTGKNWLFFGEWNRAYDYFYEDFWVELEKLDKLKVSLAFSRDQEHKIYVQDRLLENAQEVFQWLEKGAYFYVCGDAHHMAKDVDAALHQIIQEQGDQSETEAKAYIKNLRATNRYLRDIY